MKEGTVILFAPMGRINYDKCTNIGLTEHILMFTDEQGKRHASTLPYEVIYD